MLWMLNWVFVVRGLLFGMARDSCQKYINSTALYTHCLNQLLTALGSDLIHFTVLVPKVYQLYTIELWFKVYIL